MKVIIRKFLLLFMIALVALLFAGCSGTSSNTTANANLTVNSNPPSNASDNSNQSTASSEASEYPLLAAAVSQGELEALDGTKFTPADRKGSVLLLNMWGVWCGPCRSEMPHLVEMENKYHDQGFQVIGLNVGDEDHKPESIDKIEKFAGEMKLNYELVRAPQDVQEAMVRISKFDGVPQSVLVDRNGRLRGVFLGGGPSVIAKMKETVDKVVNEQ
jgi:thiol-disulfide isomerase/thioredoxin